MLKNAPNAVLVVDDLQEQETAIIELFNPVYDYEKNTLRYYVIPDNPTSINLPKDLNYLLWS